MRLRRSTEMTSIGWHTTSGNVIVGDSLALKPHHSALAARLRDVRREFSAKRDERAHELAFAILRRAPHLRKWSVWMTNRVSRGARLATRCGAMANWSAHFNVISAVLTSSLSKKPCTAMRRFRFRKWAASARLWNCHALHSLWIRLTAFPEPPLPLQ